MKAPWVPHERQGIGRELLRLTENLLWSVGHASIWLWTGEDRGTRAFRLYMSAGWTESEVKEHQLFMTKERPNNALESTTMLVPKSFDLSAEKTK